MKDCKCGSGSPREEIRVREFGYVVCCRECRKRMVQSVRDAAGDKPDGNGVFEPGRRAG
jgi:hypothetical protein